MGWGWVIADALTAQHIGQVIEAKPGKHLRTLAYRRLVLLMANLAGFGLG
jgi:hypothetical protein